ncbi:hypothetical protein BSFA1_18540 [Burkholderia sp. SFA1]|nr:hypothetical protein BSFA1_18540 [Burkholderia sp. SFA1]
MSRFKKLLAPALVSLLCIGHAHSETLDPTLLKVMGVYGPHSQFAGPYVGAKFGVNWSNISGDNGRSHTTMFPGILGGVNYDVGPVVLGFEGFADFHGGSVTKKDAGLDLKLGLPVNGNIMPYARVGFTASWPTTRVHYGAGVEYKFAKNWSVAGEYTGDTTSHNGANWNNNSLTLGLHYYFF